MAPDTAEARALPPSGDVDHLRALFVQTPATLIGYLLGAAVITWLFWPLAPAAQMLGWLAALALLWLVRLAHYLRFRRNPSADEETLVGWRTSWRALVLLQGSLWGVAGWMFWGLGTPYQRLALILVVYSYCVSSVQLLATQPEIFLGFITLVFAPAIVRIASDTTQPGHVQLAVIATILFFSTVLMVRTYGSALALAISLKARTDELAGRLRQESVTAEEARKAAEEARRAAEAASQAKTQFFAAASHDLRQPLHAMGLFAEALRQKSRDPEVASLVNSINQSVAEGFLFNPAWTGGLAFMITQPLLRNAGVAINKTFISIAQNNAVVEQHMFRGRVMIVIALVEHTYWELVFGNENLKMAQAALKAAEEPLATNRAKAQGHELRAIVDYNKSLSNLARQKATMLDCYQIEVS